MNKSDKVNLEDIIGIVKTNETVNSVALKKNLHSPGRFIEIDGKIYCNGKIVPPEDIVMLLNSSDDIIMSLKKAFQYIISENIDLTPYDNDDELFLYLEKKGVI